MKRLNIVLFITAFSLASCLETEEFDGLTDLRPDVSIEFPGRVYDQNAGLAVRITGFSTAPNIVIPMEVKGGSESISKVLSVEARGARLPAPGACGAYAVVQATEMDIDDTRNFSYSIPLSAITASGATCAATIVGAGMYYEFIFTLEMSDGSTIVTMPVRAQIVE